MYNSFVYQQTERYFKYAHPIFNNFGVMLKFKYIFTYSSKHIRAELYF